MTEKTQPIPARLKNVAVGGHVAGADDIYDDVKEVTQDVLNGAILEEKTFTPIDYSGMGRVVLKKNIVNGVNTLTQDMFYKGEVGSRVPNTNTIYVIQYDFTLGEDITVPANCVLEFDGGSLNNGTLTGNNTGIVSNHFAFFDYNVTFAGTFNVRTVIANWFKAENDAKMFNKALDFAENNILNYEGNTSNYKSAWSTVTCVNKKYTINEYIYIPLHVSFDGNGSMFVAGSGLDGLFMFYCYCRPDSSPKIYDSPTEYFGNFYFCNPSQYDVSVARINDNRVVENITSHYSNKLLVYSNYRDSRIIRNINRSIRRTTNTFDTTSNTTAGNTAEIVLWLGDVTEINHINDGISIFTNSPSDITIQNAINCDIYVVGNKNVFLKNLHNEIGSITAAGNTRIDISDSIIYPPCKIKGIWDNYIAPDLTFNNVIFANLDYLYQNNIKLSEWYPVDGVCTRTYKRVIGLGNSNHNGTLMIKDKSGYFINPIESIFGQSDELIKDDISVPAKIKTNQWGEANFYRLSSSEGTDAYVRLIALVDDKRFLYKPLTTNTKFNIDRGVALPARLSWTWTDYSSLMYGSIVRIEIGSESGQYTHYFDYGITAHEATDFDIVKDANDNYYINKIGNFLFSPIDYTEPYTAVKWYERKGNNIKCGLTADTLPNVALFNEYDEVITSSGKVYHKIGSAWVDATGATV